MTNSPALNKREIAERLRQIRASTGLSQSKFAESIGSNSQTYGTYERGTRKIGLDIISALARHYDVHADYLLYGLEKPRHDLGGLETFMAEFFAGLEHESIVLSASSKARLIAKWYREYLAGEAIPVSQVVVAAQVNANLE